MEKIAYLALVLILVLLYLVLRQKVDVNKGLYRRISSKVKMKHKSKTHSRLEIFLIIALIFVCSSIVYIETIDNYFLSNTLVPIELFSVFLGNIIAFVFRILMNYKITKFIIIIITFVVTTTSCSEEEQNITATRTILISNLEYEMEIHGKAKGNHYTARGTLLQLSVYTNEIVMVASSKVENLSHKDIMKNLQKVSKEIVDDWNATSEDEISTLVILITPAKRTIEILTSLEEAKFLSIRDSIISNQIKRDAEGYSTDAHLLEDRREKRYTQKASTESNERIENRRSIAIETAADNVGFARSVTLTK